MKLKKPLVFIDCETTGVDIEQDRMVELAMTKLISFNGKSKPERFYSLINPQRKIPSEVVAIHHITDRKVKYALTFAQQSQTILDFLGNCDFAGFNLIGFDLPLLEAEFERAGKSFSREGRSLIDIMTIYHQREKRDLVGAYLKYCGAELTGNHRASIDVQATIDIFQGQLKAYSDLPSTIEEIGALYYNSSSFVEPSNKLILVDGMVVFNFGKYKGESLSSVPIPYLEWVLHSDFSLRVKEIVREYAGEERRE